LKELEKIFKKASTDRAVEFGKKNLNILIKLQGKLRQLGEGVVLLHYLITKNKLYIIVTTPFVQLVREVQIDEKKFNQEIRVFRQTLKNLRNPKGNAETLYNWILKPIIVDLEQAKAKTLMLSLDSTLRYIPIAALYNGESEEYVAERYAIVIYTEAGKDTLKDDPVMPWTLVGLGLSKAVSGFRALPNVVTEIESIVRHNKDDQDGILEGVTYFDQDFDADTMQDVLDEGYPVMHIASHFEFKLGTDQSSFLLLGNGEKLTLAQIEEEDYDFNNLDMLTLSACNTAMGDRANGKEIEGFAMLAQNQGAKSVLATLWAVYDKSTGKFMQQFYRKKQSLNKAQALQQVQKSFINEGEYDHPYYWAPFILIGNWL
jgi:CHAT domain-containing protein